MIKKIRWANESILRRTLQQQSGITHLFFLVSNTTRGSTICVRCMHVLGCDPYGKWQTCHDYIVWSDMHATCTLSHELNTIINLSPLWQWKLNTKAQKDLTKSCRDNEMCCKSHVYPRTRTHWHPHTCKSWYRQEVPFFLGYGLRKTDWELNHKNISE